MAITHADHWPIAQANDVRFVTRILHIISDDSILECGDNWLAEALDEAAQHEQWDRNHWLFIFDQLRSWRNEYLPGAIFWRRAINRALERTIELLKKEA